MTGSAEIICVGTELLLGDILNSNAQYLAQQLAKLGISHHYQTVVGDNPIRLKQAIAVAYERSQLLIFTGGLGPTPDDITTATLANFFGVPLVENKAVLTDIKAKFAQRDRPMSDNNRKQALLPQGANILANPQGTAPGIVWQPRPGLHLMTFPGVPRELHTMWQTSAIPYLKKQGWSDGIIHSQTLKFWGTSESGLAAKVDNFLQLKNPTVAPYADDGVIKLRISAKAESLEEAEQIIKPVASQLKSIGGIDYFGKDNDTLGDAVGELLVQQHATLAVAESCTGGSMGAILTAVPGSSAYFMGGIIAYDNRVKEQLLSVSPKTLRDHGAVSPQVAEQMAVGIRQLLATDWGLSITGIAGPGGGSADKPVGLVYIGIASASKTQHLECRFGHQKSREWIRLMSQNTALDILRRLIWSET